MREDPFESEDLRQLRAEQRRALRFLPMWLITRAFEGEAPPVEVPAGDRVLLELDLRALVRREVSEVSDALVAFQTGVRARLFAEFMARLHPLASFGDELLEAARQTPDPSRIPAGADGQRLMRLARLMVLADELAPDDYTDPRLSSTVERHLTFT